MTFHLASTAAKQRRRIRTVITITAVIALVNIVIVNLVAIDPPRALIEVAAREDSLRRLLREEDSLPEHARALLGIFSRDDRAGVRQREHYRTLFEQVWNNDPRVCSLHHFIEKVNDADQHRSKNDCLLVYTFVVGAHGPGDTSKPTELVEDIFQKPVQEELSEHSLVVNKISNPYSEDVNLPDVTRLNIRENDHDGKSQTFLNFAYRYMLGKNKNLENPLIEYCIKVSPNTFFSLEKYFDFAQRELLPAPFHRGVLAGALRDKSYGMSSSQDQDEGQFRRSAPAPRDLPRLESFWGNEFEGIHLYMSGQLYILSCDLVEFILKEIPYSRSRVAPGGYMVGREGHDISSMAFHSPTPLHMITIGKSQRFWTHPLKADDHWRQLVAKELLHLANQKGGTDA